MTTTLTQHKFGPIIFTLILGIIGAIVNTLSVPFMPQVQLIFGNAAFVIVAMRLKPIYALMCALITVFPLIFIWGHPMGFITFGLEALFIAYARSRGAYVLFSDIIYWLLIGMPLTAFLIWLSSATHNEYWLFITLKQAINAALYTSLANIIAFTLDRKILFSSSQQPATNRSLLKQLMHAIVLITTFALISSALFISRNVISDSQQHIKSTLNVSASHFADASNQFMDHHERLITLASEVLSTERNENYQTTLNKIHKSSNFNNMLISDGQGVIKVSSPVDKSVSQKEFRSIADRDYFKSAIANQQTYVSSVFQGRGLGQDPIVAISAPILIKNRILGVVSGSLVIDKVSKLTGITFDNRHVEIVLLDSTNKVIHSSANLALIPLSLFDIQVNNEPSALSLLTIKGLEHTEYAYTVKTLKHGWKVYTLIDHQIVIDDIEQQYMTIFINLIITLVIAAFIAILLGRRLTRALKFIMRQINQYDEKRINNFKPLYGDASTELRQLYDEFKANKVAMSEYQLQLEEKVEQRTKELNDANKQLELLALVDGLTKVHNRRYLNNNFNAIQKSAQRNMALMAVVMIDLDHFKKLNDTYGHLAGDECLIKVAEIMKREFARETDTVVRYGGEEFLILAPYVTVAALKKKLEKLRVSIANHQFTDSQNQKFSVTASMGALIADADFSPDIIKWVKHADICLYQAKDSGRNKIIIEDKISRAN